MQCIICELEIPMGLPEPLKGQFNPDIKGVKCRFSAGYTSRFDGLQATFYICDDCLAANKDKLVNQTNFWDIFKDEQTDPVTKILNYPDKEEDIDDGNTD